MRWINSEVMKAGRNKDDDMLRAMIRTADDVESALRVYRVCNPKQNAQSVPPERSAPDA